MSRRPSNRRPMQPLWRRWSVTGAAGALVLVGCNGILAIEEATLRPTPPVVDAEADDDTGGEAAAPATCSCEPTPPPQWIPAVISSDATAACPATYPHELVAGDDSVSDPGCVCSCGPLTGASCRAAVEFWSAPGNTTCAGNKNGVANFTNVTPTKGCYPPSPTPPSAPSSGRIVSQVVDPGICTAASARAPVELANKRKVCKVEALEPCAGGTCVPPAPAPFGGRCVVWAGTGDNACPAGFSTKLTLYTRLADERKCEFGSCACTPPATTCSGATGRHCPATNACPSNCPSTLAEGVCVDLTGKQVFTELSDPPTPTGSCVPTGTPAQTGTVTVATDSRVIVCCAG